MIHILILWVSCRELKRGPKAIYFPGDYERQKLQVAFSNFLPVRFKGFWLKCGLLSLLLDLILLENVDCPSPSHALQRYSYLKRECLRLFTFHNHCSFSCFPTNVHYILAFLFDNNIQRNLNFENNIQRDLNFQVITLNVPGLREYKKRRNIFHWLKTNTYCFSSRNPLCQINRAHLGVTVAWGH